MSYDKLVRDDIPKKIRDNEEVPVTYRADEEEYTERLRDKLEEEVDEFLESGEAEELADILEVVYALGELEGMDKKDLELKRVKKAEKRGGFRRRIVLEDVE